MTRESGHSRTSVILKSIEVSRKRRREEEEEEVELHRMMMEEQVEWLEERQVFQRKRNTGVSPGGTNTTGREKYEDNVPGRMLHDPQLTLTKNMYEAVSGSVLINFPENFRMNKRLARDWWTN